METEAGRTLAEVIAELEALRSNHGGEIEVIHSGGSVGFKFVAFSQAEREREGVRDFIGVIGECGSIL